MKTPHDLVLEAKKHTTEIDLDCCEPALSAADIIIDVREPDEFNAGHIPNALNMPRGMLEFMVLDHINNADANIIVYCKTGGRAALACQSLKALGFEEPKSLSGGYIAWQEAGLKTVLPNDDIDFE